MTTLFWHETGLKMSYDDDNNLLVVEDLNPEARIAFRMSKRELRELGTAILQAGGGGFNKVPDGLWPKWGDSPNGFDGPGGAE